MKANCEENGHVILMTKEYADTIRDCGGIIVECARCGDDIYIAGRKSMLPEDVSIPDAETTKSRSQEKISDSADPQKMKVRNDHEGDN